MTQQLTFDMDGLQNEMRLPEPHKPTIDERCDAWVAKNPGVFDVFCGIAVQQVCEAGKTQVSARDIIGIMRQDADLKIVGDEYRINNSFAARLARLAEEACPALVGKFEFRVRTSQRK